MTRITTGLIVVVASLTCMVCGGGGRSAPTNPAGPSTPTPVPVNPDPQPVPMAPQVFVGAGDIGWCGGPGAEQTARLVDTIGGTVFTLGDNAYMNGTAQDYQNCYEPNWGRHKSRTRPVPGNHEYNQSLGATPYFNYFGASAGPAGRGYYSFDMGDWHAVALTSGGEADKAIPLDAGTAQAQWLRADLAANHSKCTIAYWHYPLFSSGPNGNNTQMRDFWRILYDAGVDVVVNGHDHLYERFSPQDPDGRPDSTRGIREFVVGTGGMTLYGFRPTIQANSEVRIGAYGVLKFTLSTGAYQWDFIPVAGQGQSDSGTGTCQPKVTAQRLGTIPTAKGFGVVRPGRF